MSEQDFSARAETVLRLVQEDKPEAAEALLGELYDELRSLAKAKLRHVPPGNTLQATALVHEAYLKLVGKQDPGWDGRRHFFGAAAEAMRQILVEQTRRKKAVKRGGDRKRVDFENLTISADGPSEDEAEDLLALDRALNRLEKKDERKAQIVKLRHFAGLTIAQVAEALGVSDSTVEKDWRMARSLLYTFMKHESEE
ncbi:MAG: ECF-type sigma factor [Planctomycetota bacterium]